ncbi:MAG TPA: hypothetical protein VFI22_01700, partial [Thermomicrobiales bacterium]|nr:hypothetical protein [Thermomicrobiales bacterium]
DGVDDVLVCNRIDPLPDSGVDQQAYLAAFGERLASYDDRVWTEALRDAGLRVYQTTATFFDPPALARFPAARPIDANGAPAAGFDWYHGACPTDDAWLAWKIDRIRRVVDELRPDGYFLSFTRFPGFWENWTPDYRFTNADRFCFCPRCRARFAAETGIELPAGDAATQARVILDHHHEAWTDWRCDQVVSAIARISAAASEIVADLPIMLNTLAFPARDFAGLNARREIAAQDLTRLSAVVDRFELMTYLQILRRSPDWLDSVVADARRLAPERELLCTLQVAPLYTEGIHAGRGRVPEITADDLERAGRAALDAGADGLVFYHWTDFLLDEAAGGTKRQVLRALAHG